MPIKFKATAKKSPKTGSIKYYAQVVQNDNVKTSTLITDVEKISSLSSGDVKNTLDSLQYAIIQRLKEGHTVKLDGIGTLSVTLSSVGSDEAADVNASNVSTVNVRFKAAPELRKALSLQNVTLSKASDDEEDA